MKKCSTSLGMREMQSKIMRYHHIPIRIANFFFFNGGNCWQNAEKQDLILFLWKCKMVQPLWNIIWQFLVKPNMYMSCLRNCTPEHLSQRNEDLRSHKNVYMNAHSSFICNGQNLQATHISFLRWLKQIVVYVLPWNTCYSAIKLTDLLISVTTQINFKKINAE